MFHSVVHSNVRPDSVISVWEDTGVRSIGSDHKAICVCTSTWVTIEYQKLFHSNNAILEILGLT